MIIEENTYLEHYGVLGMKWGVRKSRRELAADARSRRKKEKRKSKNRSISDVQAEGATKRLEKAKKTIGETVNDTSRKGNRKFNKAIRDEHDAIVKYAFAKPMSTIYMKQDGVQKQAKGQEIVKALFEGKSLYYEDVDIKPLRKS